MGFLGFLFQIYICVIIDTVFKEVYDTVYILLTLKFQNSNKLENKETSRKKLTIFTFYKWQFPVPSSFFIFDKNVEIAYGKV